MSAENMDLLTTINSKETTLSYEFFPPKTEVSQAKLLLDLDALQTLDPTFFSLTYGAGGTTQSLTQEWIKIIQDKWQTPSVAHMTCVGHTRQQIWDMLTYYASIGVDGILALRGDLPVNRPEITFECGDFHRASELITYIKEFNAQGIHPKGGFIIGAAAFPEGHSDTPNRLLELDYLKEKVDCGVDYLCTQLFFGNYDFFDFKERCELLGITIPILAGLLPISSKHGLTRMAELSGGTRFPAELLKAVNEASCDEDVAKIGIEHTTQQAAELIDAKVPGIHFYTLNQSANILPIVNNLKK